MIPVKLKYALFAALVVGLLAAYWVRESKHAKALHTAQVELAKLGELHKAQAAQLEHTSALLRVRNAEISAASNLCLRIEEIGQRANEIKEVFHETAKNDADSAKWHDEALPSALLDTLSGLMRGDANRSQD